MANSIYQWLMVSIVAVLHPFFVSVIEINHNTKEQTVETSIRIFSDDLEAALKKQSNLKIDLAKPADKAALDKLIQNFINQQLAIKVNGKPLPLTYIGYEQKQESTWIYFETPQISTVTKVDVTCNLLYDFQPTQMNIFHVKVKGEEKSYKLDNPKTTASFAF
jgi:hypothetical protein